MAATASMPKSTMSPEEILSERKRVLGYNCQ